MWGHDFPMLSCGTRHVVSWEFEYFSLPKDQTCGLCLTLCRRPCAVFRKESGESTSMRVLFRQNYFILQNFLNLDVGSGILVSSQCLFGTCVHVGTLQTNCYPKFNSIKTELRTLNTDSHSVNIFSILSLNLHLSQLSQRQRKQKCYTNTDKLATVFMRVPFGQNYFIFQNWVSVENLK